MTARTADDDHGYGGDAPAYDASEYDWCLVCRERVIWDYTFLAHADRHTRDRVTASEVADAEQAAIMREIRRARVHGGSEA